MAPGTGEDFSPDRVGFRALKLDDLPLLHYWMNEEPQVRRWWGGDDVNSLEKLIEKYAPRIAGDEPTRCFVIEYRGRPIGYIQDYLLADYPDWAAAVRADDKAAGVDLFIGDPGCRGGGKGAAILRKFVDAVVFARPGVESCIIGPDENNARAIRSYEKAGFAHWKTIVDLESGERDRLMRITRDALSGPSDAPRVSS